MKEHQILFKHKGRNFVLVAYWDIHDRDFIFKFRREEILDLLKDLDVIPDFKVK